MFKEIEKITKTKTLQKRSIGSIPIAVYKDTTHGYFIGDNRSFRSKATHDWSSDGKVIDSHGSLYEIVNSDYAYEWYYVNDDGTTETCMWYSSDINGNPYTYSACDWGCSKYGVTWSNSEKYVGQVSKSTSYKLSGLTDIQKDKMKEAKYDYTNLPSGYTSGYVYVGKDEIDIVSSSLFSMKLFSCDKFSFDETEEETEIEFDPDTMLNADDYELGVAVTLEE